MIIQISLWLHPIQKTQKEYCLSIRPKNSCCLAILNKLSVSSGKELWWAVLGWDCVDKSVSVKHQRNMHTQCYVWRYQNVLRFFGEVCVKAWRGEGVVLYSGVHQLMGVFNAQPTKSFTPCSCHLAKPVNTAGLRSWLSDPGADSS